MKKNEQSWKDLQNTIIYFNIHVKGIQEGGERDKVPEKNI